MAEKPELDRNTILEAEFNYIAQTVFQNHEDRANVTTFYLMMVGSFIAALISSRGDGTDGKYVNLAFAGLFLLLGLGGVRTLLELARLRQAWFNSVAAMNAIKEYCIEQLYVEDEKFPMAFQWRKLPPGFKVRSVSFLLAIQTAVLSSLAFGTMVVFLVQESQKKFAGTWPWLLAGGTVVLLLIAQLLMYGWQLHDVREKVLKQYQPQQL